MSTTVENGVIKITTKPAEVAAEPVVETVESAAAQPVLDTPDVAVSEPTIPTVFEVPDIDDNGEVATAQNAGPSLKDVLSKHQAQEIFEALEYDDFLKNFVEHYKNGGDPLALVEAKAIKYDKMTDEEILALDLKEQYPSLTKEQIQKKIARKYGIDDLADEDEQAIGMAEMSRDAAMIRNKKIEHANKFKIQERQQSGPTEADVAKQMTEFREFYNSHPEIKDMINSKSVAIKFGDGEVFNMPISKPEVVQKILSDPTGQAARRLITDDKGVPNVKLQKILTMVALNPDGFCNMLINYGKGLALPQVVSEGQNIKPQNGTTPKQTKETKMQQAAKTAKIVYN